MNKENFLFGIIGLLLGLIVGFMVANSINQRGYVQGSPASTTSDKLPPDHPPIDSTGSGPAPGANLPALKQSEARADSTPQSFDAQMEAGMLAYELKNFPDALRYLERARQLKPDDFDVLSQLG